jgi:hypothetical protein
MICDVWLLNATRYTEAKSVHGYNLSGVSLVPIGKETSFWEAAAYFLH